MAWVNPFYNPGNSVAGGGNVRYDHTQPGAGIPGARTFTDGARLYDAYKKSGGNTVAADADAWMREKGFDPATASDQVKFTALDWVFRDRRRSSNKTNSFSDSVLGKVIGVAAPIAGGLFGGIPGATIGGAIGGGAQGGLKGAALGAGAGYLGSKFVKPWVQSQFGTSGVAPPPTGSVAGRALNAALPGTFGAGTPALSAGSGALGLGTAGVGVGLGAGALLNGAAGAAAGGKSVGLFDNFLGGLGSVAGSVAGDLIGGFIGGKGDDKAFDQFNQAAQNSQLIVNPSPFQANSLFLQTGADGRATARPFGQKQINNISQLNDAAFGRASGFNRNEFRDRLLEAANRVNDKREQQQFSSLESKLFNRQGASTGTQRQIADFKSDIEDRRYNRAVQSELVADQVQRGRAGDFAGTFSMLGGMDDRFRNLQGQSLVGAQALAPYGINNPAIAQAGALRAQNTMDFFRGLGGTVGGLADTAVSSIFAPASTPQAQAQPASTVANPFAGVGPLQSFQNNYNYLGF